jgi:UDP-glucose 4-epimerase
VGGAGYIGSHVARHLLNQGLTPIILDDLSTGHREAARRATNGGPFYLGSYGDSELVSKILVEHKVTAVMHFGAKALVGESVENPLKYYTANVSLTLNLLQAMLKCGVKNFIFSSTCATFGDPAGLPMNEELAQKPINPYGQSKLFVERILADFELAYGLRSGVLRYFNAAGAAPEGDLGEDHRPETHLIPNVFKAALSDVGGKIVVNGDDYPTPDGSCVRDYIHVNDLADAHLKMLNYLSSKSKSLAVNLGVGSGYSVFEIIRSIEKIVGKKIETEVGPRRPGDPPTLVAQPLKAQEMLGWRAQSDLDGIIESVYRWMKNHPTGY